MSNYRLSFREFRKVLNEQMEKFKGTESYPKERGIYFYFLGFAKGAKNAKVNEQMNEVHFFFAKNHAIITQSDTVIY